jgi:hypothetical protein
MSPNSRQSGNFFDMKRTARTTIRFLLGTGCVIAAVVGAFHSLAWFYFAVLFAGGCGMIGQRSIWEKIAFIARGNDDHGNNGPPLKAEAHRNSFVEELPVMQIPPPRPPVAE